MVLASGSFGHYWGMAQSAEFEAAVMERRVAIHALRVEARRVTSEGEGVWELGVTIPAGWLPALAHGLDYVMKRWRREEDDERVDGPATEEDRLRDAELFERMQSLATAIRDLDPADAYVVSARDREALFKGAAGALSIQEYEVQRLPEPEYVDPSVWRFVVIEQRDALGRFVDALWDLSD